MGCAVFIHSLVCAFISAFVYCSRNTCLPQRSGAYTHECIPVIVPVLAVVCVNVWQAVIAEPGQSRYGDLPSIVDSCPIQRQRLPPGGCDTDRVSDRNLSGCMEASLVATIAPMECPISWTGPHFRVSCMQNPQSHERRDFCKAGGMSGRIDCRWVLIDCGGSIIIAALLTRMS